MDVSSYVRYRLQQGGITQLSLGEHLGISQPQVSRRLTGHTEWSLDDLVALAELFGMPIDSLVREVVKYADLQKVGA